MNEINRLEIGKRIEKIRCEKLNNISKIKLGESIGTTGQNMGLIINGKGSISLEKAIRFCEFADVSMDYVFRGIENNNQNSELIDVYLVNKAITEYNNFIKM